MTMASDGAEQAMQTGQAEAASAAAVYDYRAYGLAIRSELPLPELEPDVFDQPDVVIRARPSGHSIEGLTHTDFQFAPDRQYLAWPKVASFVIHGVGIIDVDAYSTANAQMARLPLLGPVMALLLHLRGMLVLHASAIGIGDRCVIFMGDKGAGKSTTAAALIAAGHQLLTDDVVAIDFSKPDDPRIAPGFPQMKLDPDLPSSSAFETALTLPEPVPDFPKRLWRLTGDFSHDYVSPARICVLTRGTKAAITPLAPQEALISLMRFSYASRFSNRSMTREDAANHLKQCSLLASSGRVCRLEVPTGVERLPEAVALLEQELGFVPPAGRAS